MGPELNFPRIAKLEENLRSVTSENEDTNSGSRPTEPRPHGRLVQKLVAPANVKTGIVL